jgi:hypothetical protein
MNNSNDDHDNDDRKSSATVIAFEYNGKTGMSISFHSVIVLYLGKHAFVNYFLNDDHSGHTKAPGGTSYGATTGTSGPGGNEPWGREEPPPRLPYNTPDHCWVALSHARTELGIKTPSREEKSKKFDLRGHGHFEIIWQKDLVVLKPARAIRWYGRDRENANQERDDQGECGRLRMAKLWLRKSPSTIWSLNDHHFLAFIVYR